MSACLSTPQMQQMYDMIMQHKRAMQDMQLLWEKALQQHQHGYDSDEEVDSELGTWEHQLRRMEMDKTRGVWGMKGREPHLPAPLGHSTWSRGSTSASVSSVRGVREHHCYCLLPYPSPFIFLSEQSGQSS